MLSIRVLSAAVCCRYSCSASTASRLHQRWASRWPSRKPLGKTPNVEELSHFRLSERLPFLRKPIVFALLIYSGSYALSKLYGHESSTSLHRFNMVRFQGFMRSPSLWWKAQSASAKLTWICVATNVTVFALWFLAPHALFLQKYFLANVYGAAPCLSMLGSMFSHKNYLHLLVNMYVLTSVSEIIQNPAHLAHVYISGGVFAALGSYIRTVLTPGLCVQSLGASGAILTMIGYTVFMYPESRFSLVGLDLIYPHSFTAKTAFTCLLAFDTCGLVFGWRLFDHAAHLVGLMFGGFSAVMSRNRKG